MKTFILFWNPAISSYHLDNFQKELEEIRSGYNNMNWSVWEHNKAHDGDRFFMVRCGSGKTGICMSGYFISEPYKGEDWSGKGRTTYYMDLEPDVMLHPEYIPILSTTELTDNIPSFDWTGGHSGRLLKKKDADKLEELWKLFIDNNAEAFTTRSFRQELTPTNYAANKEKSKWLLEKSRLYAEYAGRHPGECDKIGTRFENKKYGWIHAYFSVNGEEKSFIELSNVYEPFSDIKKWLESIVINEQEYKHHISMVEINCEGYGAVLYYEPNLLDELNL